MPHELLEFDHYLSKTYRKTAALMSLSCEARAADRIASCYLPADLLPTDRGCFLPRQSSARLGGHGEEVQAALQAYGRHLGIAYQVRSAQTAAFCAQVRG